jgi:RNA methyltransferase, TrmH family
VTRNLGPAITSTTNPRVKRLVRLAERRDRDAENLFLAEGMRAVERLLAAGRSISELYVAPEWFADERVAADLIAASLASGAEIVHLGREAFAKCTYRERPEGLLGLAPQWKDELQSLALSSTPLLVVAEGVEKPGNLGSILRSADAAGCDGVILCDSAVDRFNPNVIRASTGVVFSMPIIEATRDEATSFMMSHDIVTVATTPDASTVLYDVDLSGPVAILMGAEDTGLSPEWLAAADMQVRLPMLGQADSLNVAMATVVTLYEAIRQRR